MAKIWPVNNSSEKQFSINRKASRNQIPIRNSIAIIGLALSLIAPQLCAQEASPKPSPEIQKMGIFLGKWHLEEEGEATPFGPAGKSTMETEIRFMHDGFFMEETGKGKGSDGSSSTYTILYYYDTPEKTLQSFYYGSHGTAVRTVGALEGNAWKNQWSQQFKGKDYKCKGVSTVSPDGKEFTYEWSYSEDGGTWKRMLRGTATKVADAPKTPGPEHKKLEMGAGKWESEGENFESPFGPAGKTTGTGESRMILGGFFLEGRWQIIGPKGPSASVEIIAYDSEKSHYQSSFFYSGGEFDQAWKGETPTCTIQGDTWNWSWNEEKGAKKYHCREVGIFAADRKSFTFEGSYSEDGKVWKKRYEAKATKVGNVHND